MRYDRNEYHLHGMCESQRAIHKEPSTRAMLAYDYTLLKLAGCILAGAVLFLTVVELWEMYRG